ncbi:MAG: alpha-L-rhamnosidase N-terminal domain-containing protein [Clostridia bacterium]|nr:alpha-L-rhamnosidase N-terminal domain-containing protein [Clostridia bacterium]
MNKEKYFGSADWVEFSENPVSVLARKDFDAKNIEKAKLSVIGLGFFEGYINGKLISEDRFLPLNTDFHKRELIRKNGVWKEETAHRIYVTEYDVTPLISDGKNSLCFMLGNGWYACTHQERFGDKKLIFSLSLTHKDGNVTFINSDETVLYKEGFIKVYDLTEGETQDFTDYTEDWLYPETDCSSWKNASVCEFPETRYMTSDCPPDRVKDILYPAVIKATDDYKIYDIGKHSSGNLVLLLPAGKGRVIKITGSEEKTDSNELEVTKIMEQEAQFICGDTEREASQVFTWHASRFFRVPSDIKVIRFDVIHTDVDVNSSFDTDNKVLKWLYDAFINTQLSNMHTGIPSDCPHLERRGYTGDGQLACDAVMTTMDVKKFYDKWIEDISDCQDRLTGHVQNTAPYTHSGGGPGGWGGAIVHVPFMYYKHYGDPSYMIKLYPQMLHYFKYLDAHSRGNLVWTDIPDEWCLGDWCTPTKIRIPEPFVNTYFYIKHIDEILYCKDVLKLSGKDVKALKDKRKILVAAIKKRYFDPKTGDFAKNIQGANAFAIDIGLGTKKTFINMCAKYDEKHMYYNTGIFGTDILTRVLFKNGRGDIAVRLLASEGKYSFGNIMNQGATTLWEYWTGKRSHSHPMFGAVVSYLFEYILGISQPKDSYGYAEIVIAPKDIKMTGTFGGKITVPAGEISVSISYTESSAQFDIELPKEGIFRYKDTEISLTAGKNEIIIEEKNNEET